MPTLRYVLAGFTLIISSTLCCLDYLFLSTAPYLQALAKLPPEPSVGPLFYLIFAVSEIIIMLAISKLKMSQNTRFMIVAIISAITTTLCFLLTGMALIFLMAIAIGLILGIFCSSICIRTMEIFSESTMPILLGIETFVNNGTGAIGIFVINKFTDYNPNSKKSPIAFLFIAAWVLIIGIMGFLIFPRNINIRKEKNSAA